MTLRQFIRQAYPITILAALLVAGLVMNYEPYVAAEQVTVQSPLGAYPGPVSATDLAVTFTYPASAPSSVTFTITGNEFLLIYNATTTVQSLDFESVATPYGRSADISTYYVAPLGFAAFHYSDVVGWRNASSLAASCTPGHASLGFCVLRY